MVICADFPGISCARASAGCAENARKPAIYRENRWIATASRRRRRVRQEGQKVPPDGPAPLVGVIMGKRPEHGKGQGEAAMAKTKSAAKAKVRRSTTSGRAAIVNGGASGIGLACVEALVNAGWQVGILDRDEKSLERARERFR